MILKKHLNSGVILQYILLFLVASLLAYLIFNNAWVTEDAYINFRSLEQFSQGNGLRWNIYERVQVFTSPLWFLLQLPLVWISKNYFINVIALSVVLQIGLWYLFWRLCGRNLMMLLAALAVCLASNAFIDYSTSGLENPLVHLLLIGVFGFYQLSLKTEYQIKHLIGFLLCCALLIFTRHDMATLAFLPFLHMLFLKRKDWKQLCVICLVCGLPFVLWSAFSLIYYGSIFPNTAYAKLDTGVETEQLYQQGLDYLFVCLVKDPVTVLVIALAFVVGLFSKRHWVFSLSLLCSMFYIVSVGGDFMLGRFLTPAFVLSLFVLIDFLFRLRITQPQGEICIAIGLSIVMPVFIVVFNSSVYNQPWDSGKTFLYQGVSDERLKWSEYMSLHKFLKREKLTEGAQNDHGMCIAANFRFRVRNKEPVFVSGGAIGVLGYCAGVKQVLIDPLALGDPLLSRLPLHKQGNWSIGHIRRDIPEGYVESLETGENKIKDPAIAALYDDVKLVTQSDTLFSRQRFAAIWRLNTGAHAAVKEWESHHPMRLIAPGKSELDVWFWP